MGRRLILAKADATLIAGSCSFPLFTNRWNSGAVAPAGHVRIASFHLDHSVPVWSYEVPARFALFALCLVLAWVAGLSGPLLLVVALIASGVLSWFVLRRPRIAMSGAVERRMSRLQSSIDARAGAEDAYVDSLQGTTHPGDPAP